jgi:hypothetical protein
MTEENDFGFIACTEEELQIAAKVASTNSTTPAPAVVNVDLAPVNSALSRIEQKMDKVLAMELHELSTAVSEQGSTFENILGEIEERVSAERATSKEKLLKVENLVIPLLNNLMKNPEKEFIKWPNRVEKIQIQIQKILEVTRSI